ncbi:glutamine--tRNA ligase/YqeY domain fusion protein [Candidatus Profftella armatura]|uniref:Glutamine--tRNA ligase n=1 Tax=Candidatus Profftella armatura TaxID=669502 RepID=S5RM12_9PROT|nr:glutamine--tRNA ligase/YqeY domain fusion protein [Candidatus Profftella armatura]AGS06981.1 glutaminyl-tRNA synthetase [Candidatus Profftella armatura]ALC96047.1 glutaminyl-tRNA synthetase [Candidatus Profftella armatura]
MNKKIKNSSVSLESNNFIKNIIKKDIIKKTFNNRYDKYGNKLPQVITRFAPEPNGYLHIGHAKSIFINFELAYKYNGLCNLRFDDTNPLKENKEYVNSIIKTIKWLNFNWDKVKKRIYYASDYFDILYKIAEYLIISGDAYVDSQNTEEIYINRGNLHEPGRNSPFYNRLPSESLNLFRRMRSGEFKDGAHVLRVKINMKSKNINMRDPIIYRIRHVNHYRTNNNWCIYPMYDYAHPISDAIENITHSICTLEFQDHRPFYEWILNKIDKTNFIKRPFPKQYEFSRLNLTHTITSKRKLLKLLEKKIVDGWDDPRMPTLIGMRRRGYTPESIKLFCKRIGVSKSDSWINIEILEQALRDDLNIKAPRIMAVLNPIKLIISNFLDNQEIECTAPLFSRQHTQYKEKLRYFPISKILWIERDDFMEIPTKKYFRLYPPIGKNSGNRVRLRYGYVVECTGFKKNKNNEVVEVYCKYFPDSKSGTKLSSNYKVKGNIHWISKSHALSIEARLYDRLFIDPYPNIVNNKDFKLLINPNSKKVISAYLEPNLKLIFPKKHAQFERHGYFILDDIDSNNNKIIFNQSVELKNKWKKMM